jgi:excisionase family DNA binding protein
MWPYPQMVFPHFNTVEETAAVLRADRKTVYDAIARGEIPVVRLGRAIRVPGTWLRQAAGLSEPTTPSATT